MTTSRKLDVGCRRSGWWGCPTLFFNRHHKSSKQLVSHPRLAPATPPRQYRQTGRVSEHAHIRKAGYGLPPKRPAGPSHITPQNRHKKTSKQLVSHLALAPSIPPRLYRQTGRVSEHAHIRKAGYGPPSQWPVGPQQAVDGESTQKTRTPTEDGHEVPFFLTGGVESV